MISTKAKVGLSLGALVVAATGLWLGAMAGRGNEDAFEGTVKALSPDQQERVTKLATAELAGLVRTEMGGVVMQQSPGTQGKTHRVYLAWMVIEPEATTHKQIADMLVSTTADVPDADLAVAVYANVSPYSLRASYGMSLAHFMQADGLSRVECSCYRWNVQTGAWKHVATVPGNEALLRTTLGKKDFQALMDGTYNAVRWR